MRPALRSTALLAGLALLLLAPATELVAQQLADAPRSVRIAARVGYDVEVSNGALILGGGVRASLPGPLPLEVQGLADFTFLNNLTERQANVDVLWQFRGVALGGGPAWRNTIWLNNGARRETRTGVSGVAIFGGAAGRGLLSAQLELRYTKVSDFTPSAIMIGVNLPLARF